jgi:hypothetical protein
MKNIKTKIILSAVAFLLIGSFAGTVYAADASLYISPASLTKTVGNIFSVSGGVNASGNKVCAVEGTLVFNNVSCQSITVASGLMAQSTPTCSNPYFLIGIPNCSTSSKALFTISVKAGSAGTASIGLTSVDVIGEGASVGSTGTSGNYTINAVSAPVPAPTSTSTPKSNEQTTAPAEPITEQIETVTEPTAETSENNLVANVGATGATSGWAIAFWTLLGLDIIYALAHGTYYIKKKRKHI